MTEVEWTFKDDSGGLLVVMPTALNILIKYRQMNRLSNEAAGVLIGERRGKHIIVYEVSEPGDGDIRRRCFVDRRGPHHQLAVDDAFARSSGRLQYLGEWHTHPEDYPSPSSIDIGTWHRNLSTKEDMVLMIIGRKGVWAARKTPERPQQLLRLLSI
ncbi:Mov34/MPN/PAD-1 family protein [Metapseudomonas otitidis]|uniref:CBASS system CD-NTase/cGAS isopeptidase Cap3 n=1 Tax=Metapseudomonas otitidis TaxID=319939 RepID=UPI003C7E582F